VRHLGFYLSAVFKNFLQQQQQPSHFVFIVVTLALAIGLNSAIFAVVYSVLLRPLPFYDPSSLVRIWESNPTQGRERENVSPANFLDWKSQSRSFSGLAYWRDTTMTLIGKGEPVDLPVEQVSADFFSVLAPRPALGRTFRPNEGRQEVAVLSHDLWEARFGSDASWLGQMINLDREPYLVIGVMPAGFKMLGRDIDVWIPLQFAPGALRHRRYLEVVGRLRRGVSRQSAQADLATVAIRLAKDYPQTNQGWGVRLMPLHEQLVHGARRPLLILLGATGLVVLIACANVAALLLARSIRRDRELAIRNALGATRGHLIRQFLAESLVLALSAAALGFLIARWGLSLLLAAEPGDLPRVREVVVDSPVLLYTSVLALATVLLFGLLPALRASQSQLETGLREAGAVRGGQGLRHRLSLHVLTVGEIALAAILLVSTGLLLRSFLHLRAVDPGFSTTDVLVGRISLDKNSYREDQQVLDYFSHALAALRSLPGVLSAGAVTALPLSPVGIDFEVGYHLEGQPAPESRAPQVAYRVVTPDYFRALSIPLLRGRDFSTLDRAGAPGVAIVNERMTHQAWPGQSPLGRRITLASGAPQEDLEVIGVVGNTRHYGLETEPRSEVFVPQAQTPFYSDFYVVIRTASDPGSLAKAVRQEVLKVDPTQPFSELFTMEDRLSDSIARDRFLLLLLGLMATLALFLALTGIYAVISYSVSQRFHEIAVRIALGAPWEAVLGMMMKEGGLLALTGITLGLTGAWILSGTIGGLLFGIGVHDASTYLGGAVVLLVTALLATYLPARRAAAVDPTEALRRSG
jgi:putative ABC transport system permease protein